MSNDSDRRVVYVEITVGAAKKLKEISQASGISRKQLLSDIILHYVSSIDEDTLETYRSARINLMAVLLEKGKD